MPQPAGPVPSPHHPRARISVVVPARDEARRLPACLAAVAAQTRPADEVVVVDNASSDGTAQIARRAGARVVRQDRTGVWHAAATGYDAARGDVIARIDADTVLPPGWLDRVERTFAAHPEVSAVTGPGRFRGLGRLADVLADRLYMRGYFRLGALALGGPPLFGSACAIRASAWQAARGDVHTEHDVHDDLDLSFHLPGAVRYDAGLTVSISARPLRTGAGMATRVARGWRSVVLHWPERGPWRPAQRRVRAAGRRVRATLGRRTGRAPGPVTPPGRPPGPA